MRPVPQPRPAAPRVIVVGNEKGGSGKSTTAIHLTVALLMQGQRVGCLDLDARQATLARHLENRRAHAAARGIDLALPSFRAVPRSQGLDRAERELEEREAFEQARRFWELGMRNFRMAVNLSARQFQELDLHETVASILRDCDVSPGLIEIEITESSILKDADRVGEVLQSFNDLGLLVALDDFGTGFSSLNQLKNFPGATIKIDQSFVQHVLSNASDAAIVRAVIEMAHNLGLRVIAEGIETEGQLEFLRQEGCDAVQGFYLFRPACAARITMERLAEVAELFQSSHSEVEQAAEAESVEEQDFVPPAVANQRR